MKQYDRIINGKRLMAMKKKDKNLGPMGYRGKGPRLDNAQPRKG